MKKVTKIADNLSVIMEAKGNKRTLSLEENGNILFSKRIKEDHDHFIHFKYDDTYIMFFEFWLNKAVPPRILRAYSITEKRFLDLEDEKIVKTLQYMYDICAERFDLSTILEFLNNGDIKAASSESVIGMYEFITNGNWDISHDEVKNYIYNYYPKLKEYSNFERPITVLEYNKIGNALNHKFVVSLGKMPQLIETREEKVVRERKK